MKIIFQSYNTCMQNESGGVNRKIQSLYKYLKKNEVRVEFFSKFEDKIKNYDILHIFKANIENLQLIELAKKNNVKVVISSIIPCTDKFKIKSNLILCNILPITTGIEVIRKSLELADHIITESEDELNFINKYYKINKSKMSIIENGVEEKFLEEYTENNNYKLKLPKKYVLCVGRFDDNKNQISLIKAFMDTDIPIVFLGGATHSTKGYFEECKKYATSNMYFLDWVDSDDDFLVYCYKNAQVLVSTSKYETFGISIIEGAVCGANIAISSTLPISKYDIFSKYTFNPNDIEDIRKKVMKAFKEDQDVELKAKAVDLFSWDEIAKKHMYLYRRIL